MKINVHDSMKFLVFFICLIAAAMGRADVSENESFLLPVDISQFVVRSDQRSEIQFAVNERACSESIDYLVKNYLDQVEIQSSASCKKFDRVIVIELSISRGYHEIIFPALRRSFGVISSDELHQRSADFFGVDTAFSFLGRSRNQLDRIQYIKQLSKLGLWQVRDRLDLREFSPDGGNWNGSTSTHRFDDLRTEYKNYKINVLDVLQGLSDPDDYSNSEKTQLIIPKMTRHWGALWSAVEIGNEPNRTQSYKNSLAASPDAYFRDYSAFTLKTSDLVKQNADGKIITVGGAFGDGLSGGRFDARFIEGVTSHGFLKAVDAISFHTYVDAFTLQGDIALYRAWLRRAGYPNKPLWITESGWFWKVGPARPPLNQDQESALQIAGKAVVAYSLDIQRYYPFVYAYYEEKGKNFGMTGRERTPLRSLAAYIQTAKVLSHASVVLPIQNKTGFGQGAIFRTQKGLVIVLMKARRGEGPATLQLPFDVLHIEGIDGRALKIQDGKFVTDDMQYIWIAENSLAQANDFLK